MILNNDESGKNNALVNKTLKLLACCLYYNFEWYNPLYVEYISNIIWLHKVELEPI